jgi:hypothetical protein
MKKKSIKSQLIAALAISNLGIAQEHQLDNFNPSDKRSINAFEPKKDSVTTFDHLRVKVGGAFALQFQGLSHENTATPLLLMVLIKISYIKSATTSIFQQPT